MMFFYVGMFNVGMLFCFYVRMLICWYVNMLVFYNDGML